MSIASEITRISGNVSDSLSAVAAKGVTVPSGSNSDDLAGLIALINSGGLDIPIFTQTWDDNWETVVSLTCNKTYSQCVSINNAGYYSGVLLITDQSHTEENYFGMGVREYADMLVYTGVTNNIPGFEVQYNSNNTMVYSDNPRGIDSLNATSNGTYNAPTGKLYKTVTVNVSGGSGVVVTEEPDSGGGVIKNITAVDLSNDTVDAAHLLYGYTAHDSTGTAITGSYTPSSPSTQTKTATPTESEQLIEPDSGYLLSSVTVEAISSTYIGSDIPTRTSSDMSVVGRTVVAPAGFYASPSSAQVAQGTAGTPTATKGTVSNHSISVTPSVTNTAGYISGSTINGTAVTVDASELVSGTYNVTSSGTKDVTNYASASVPAGTATAPSTITGTSATVSTGTNTLTLTKTVSVTPSVTTAGYVSSGTAGNSSVSLTASVTTQAAQTIHPSTSDQTIASGRYLTGAQTIKAVTTSNLSASNILSGVTIKVGDSSDDDCVASVTGNVTFQTYYTGSSAPSSSLGVNGDIYLQTS